MNLILKTVQVVKVDHAATGIQLLAYRTKAGLSLRALGKKCGLSIGYLSDLEHGRRTWTEKRVEQFNRLFQVRP